MRNLDKAFVSIVIPIYNEEDNIPELTRRLIAVMKNYKRYEIIYVNDGSSDQSEALIEQYSEKNLSIKLLSLSRNFGHQVAISAGIAHVSGEVVAIMDGDLQDPPEVLHKFFAKWCEGYDVVYAIRKKRKENLVKRALYFVFYRLIEKISDINIPLDSGDFSVMDQKIIDKLNALPESNRFVRGMRAWLGYKQVGLEYERDRRFAGKPKYTFRMLVQLAYDGLVSFSRKPLHLATQIGMVVTLFSFVYIVIILIKKLFFMGVEIEGWTSTIIVTLFMGGIQLLMLGVLGEYIGRIFDETKRRPNYLIAKSRNLNI